MTLTTTVDLLFIQGYNSMHHSDLLYSCTNPQQIKLMEFEQYTVTKMANLELSQHSLLRERRISGKVKTKLGTLIRPTTTNTRYWQLETMLNIQLNTATN